jgi:hypothetical protein
MRKTMGEFLENRIIKKSLKKVAKGAKGSRPANKTRKFQYVISGGNIDSNNKQNYFFSTDRITVEPNKDPDYKEIGVIHVTESAAVNIGRGFFTGVANAFGSSGFDNSVYDLARNSALNSLISLIQPNTQKICNLRMDITNSDPSLFFVHAYGTVFENASLLQQPVEQAQQVEQAQVEQPPV